MGFDFDKALAETSAKPVDAPKPEKFDFDGALADIEPVKAPEPPKKPTLQMTIAETAKAVLDNSAPVRDGPRRGGVRSEVKPYVGKEDWRISSDEFGKTDPRRVDRKPVTLDAAGEPPRTAADMLNVGVDAGQEQTPRNILDRPRPPGAPLDPQGFEYSPQAQERMAKERRASERQYADNPSLSYRIGQEIKDATKNPVARGAVTGFSELGKVGVGAVRLVADLTGADTVGKFAAGAANAADTIGTVAGQGLVGNEKLVADVTSSILNSLPSLALGVAGGPALKGLFVQSTLNEYNAGRDANFGVEESLARAGIMGFAEALGERFGFPEQIAILKSVVKGMPQGDMAKAVGSMLMKEIPGEQLTTLMQFLADKVGPAALSPNATLAEYLEAAAHTLKVTIGQTAVMGGGPALLSETRKAQRKADSTSMTAGDQAAGAAAGVIDQQADLWGKYFGGRDPVTGDKPPPGPRPPTQARADAIKRFDELAAAFGLDPDAAARVKEQAGAKPADEVPGFLSRVTEAFNRRGLFKKPVDDAGVEKLNGMLNAPDEEPPAAGAKSGPSDPNAPGGAPADAPMDAGSLLGTVDDDAHAAAPSPQNDLPEPTEAQKEAGNYPKGHTKISGLDVSIENPQGSVRRGVDEDGKAWENELQHHYGYIRGTEGNDGDHVDTFIRPGTPKDYSGPVFIVDQQNPKTGKFDEHKVMLGFDGDEDALQAYQSNYAPGWKGLRSINKLTMEQFKAWVKDGDHKQPFYPAMFKEAPGASRKPDVPVPAPMAPEAGAPGTPEAGGSAGPVGSRPDAEPGSGVQAPAPAPDGRGRAPEPAGVPAGKPAPALSNPKVGDDAAAEARARLLAKRGQKPDNAPAAPPATPAKIIESAPGGEPAGAAPAPGQRTLNEDGRAADGKPINPGDTFRTASGRTTTPYPKQKGEKYASQWLIDNAIAEAQSRGDDFNATGFGGERPLKGGELAPASRDSMLMYLFGQQPDVPPSILKPLNAAPAVVNDPAVITEQDGKFYVRFGDDRAAHGPIKTRKLAEEYAARGQPAPKPKPTPNTGRAAGKVYPKTVWGSEMLGEINRQLGGLSLKLRDELSFRKETGLKDRNGKPRTVWFNPSGGENIGGFFRDGGIEDTIELAEWMESEGYITPGSVAEDSKAAEEQARSLVTAALNRAEPERQTGQEDEWRRRLEAAMGPEPEVSDQAVERGVEAGYDDLADDDRALVDALMGVRAENTEERDTEAIYAFWQSMADVEAQEEADAKAIDDTPTTASSADAAAEGASPRAPPEGGADRQGDGGQAEGADQDQGLDLTAPTREQVLAQQAALEKERLEREAREKPADKPKGKLTGEQIDLLNPQGGIFDNLPPGEQPAPSPEDGWQSRGGKVYDLMRGGELLAQVANANHVGALRPYYFTGGSLIARVHPEIAERKFVDLATAKAAAEDIAAGKNPEGMGGVPLFPTIDQLRADLRKIEEEILASAPQKFRVGGGDIEGAMAHPNVPKGAKIVRNGIKERIRAMEKAAPAEPEQAERDWKNATQDEIADEIERLSLVSREAYTAQLTMDGAERASEIAKMDAADRQIIELQKLLPDEEAQQEDDAEDDGPYEPPDNWRESMFQARTYAKELGIPMSEYSGKELAEVVALVEKKLGLAPQRKKRMTPAQKKRAELQAAQNKPPAEQIPNEPIDDFLEGLSLDQLNTLAAKLEIRPAEKEIFRTRVEMEIERKEPDVAKLAAMIGVIPLEGGAKADQVVNGRPKPADAKPEECLLFMPCGQSKLDTRARADALYTGPMWQTLRTHSTDATRPRLAILSAEHGMVRPDRELEPYDRQMTAERADELAGQSYDQALHIAKELGLGTGPKIRDVQIVGGAEYRRVMRSVVAVLQRRGVVPKDASIREIAGEIGEQRQQLGGYLDSFQAPKASTTVRRGPAWADTDGDNRLDSSGDLVGYYAGQEIARLPAAQIGDGTSPAELAFLDAVARRWGIGRYAPGGQNKPDTSVEDARQRREAVKDARYAAGRDLRWAIEKADKAGATKTASRLRDIQSAFDRKDAGPKAAVDAARGVDAAIAAELGNIRQKPADDIGKRLAVLKALRECLNV